MSLYFPPDLGPDREQFILDQVKSGNYSIEWAEITSTHGGHVAKFSVFADALKIEGIRIGMSAKTEQLVADELGCMLLTPKLADLIWQQRIVTLPPFPRQFTASTQAMFEHSAQIDSFLAKLGDPNGLRSTVGKHWVIDNSLATISNRAMNYGWHFVGSNFQGTAFETSASDPNTRLIQGRGTRHDMNHSDYSQTCVLVCSTCCVDDQTMQLTDLLKDPDLAPLASCQGTMNVFRQPGA